MNFCNRKFARHETISDLSVCHVTCHVTCDVTGKEGLPQRARNGSRKETVDDWVRSRVERR